MRRFSFAPAPWGTNFHSGGKHGAQTLPPVFQPGRLRDFQEDAIDAAIARQRVLGGREVHHYCGFIAVRIGVHATHGVSADLIVDEELDAIACFIPSARTNPNAVCIAQMLERILRSARRRRLGNFGRISLRVSTGFGDKIKPNEWPRLLGIRDRRIVLDAWRNSDRIRKNGQRTDNIFWNASRCRDFQIVIASEGFQRATERAGGGSPRKIDRQDNRDPQRRRQDRQGCPHRFTEERAHHQSVKEQKERHFSAR
jgi:hypothetical protein